MPAKNAGYGLPITAYSGARLRQSLTLSTTVVSASLRAFEHRSRRLRFAIPINGRDSSLGLAGSRCMAKTEGRYDRHGGEPYQPHPGTQCHRCGCSLPGLTGFTADRCGGTGRAHHDKPAWRRAAPLYRLISNLQPLPTNGKNTGRTLGPAAGHDRRSAAAATAWLFYRIASKPSSQRRSSVRGWGG